MHSLLVCVTLIQKGNNFFSFALSHLMLENTVNTNSWYFHQWQLGSFLALCQQSNRLNLVNSIYWPRHHSKTPTFLLFLLFIQQTVLLTCYQTMTGLLSPLSSSSLLLSKDFHIQNKIATVAKRFFGISVYKWLGPKMVVHSYGCGQSVFTNIHQNYSVVTHIAQISRIK